MVDTFAHGLIGYLSVGRSNYKKSNKDKKNSKKLAFLSIFFGILPDLMSWTIFLIYNLINGTFGRPRIGSVPEWVLTLYGISHSIFVFGFVILTIYLIKKTIPIYLWAWGLHIAVDVPTHSREFLPTPFLWPINWYFDGISWGKLFPWYWIPLTIWFFYTLYKDNYSKNNSKKK